MKKATILILIIIIIGFVIYNNKQANKERALEEQQVVEVSDMELAEEALLEYFDLLSSGQYEGATRYHGSGYRTLEEWNPGVSDPATLLKNGCEANGWQCEKVVKTVEEEEISESEFKFWALFDNPDLPLATFIVKKEGEGYLVTNPPIYLP